MWILFLKKCISRVSQWGVISRTSVQDTYVLSFWYIQILSVLYQLINIVVLRDLYLFCQHTFMNIIS